MYVRGGIPEVGSEGRLCVMVKAPAFLSRRDGGRGIVRRYPSVVEWEISARQWVGER